jgi:hypothetical protein
MKQAIIKKYDLDYKSLEFMLISEDAEQFNSAAELLKKYDARDAKSLSGISNGKLPLYVLHGVKELGLVCEYSIVYDASLNAVGYLD